MKIIAIILLLSIGISQPIFAQNKNNFSWLPGFQVNKRSYDQGASVGVNIGFNFTRENIYHKGDSIQIHQSLILNFNHHFNPKPLKGINSQSIEFAYFPGFKQQINYPFIGIGAEVRHFDFNSFVISPKVNVNLLLFSIYAQRNYGLQEENSISNSKFTFGIEFNTTTLVGTIERSLYGVNFPGY